MVDLIAPPNVPDLVVCCILRFVAWGLYGRDHRALASFILTCRTARRHAQELLDELVYLTTRVSVIRFAERVRQDRTAFPRVRLLSILADVDTSDPHVIDDLKSIIHRCKAVTLELSASIFQECASRTWNSTTIFITRACRPHLCDFQAISHSHGYQNHIKRLVINYDQHTRVTEAVVHLGRLTHIAIVITKHVELEILEELLENMARYRRLHVVFVGTATSLRGTEAFFSKRYILSFNTVVFDSLSDDTACAPTLQHSLYVRTVLGDIDMWQDADMMRAP
ncbi:hypothetical protein AURDEDRAFT_185709 [Auricularia subglabra TFB-10046 SS5]|nr:hypothetical protein AURDEDRAFT_185709 [Auricularia subglabra TFB-10046 SS5]